jgi:hypothetical protein
MAWARLLRAGVLTALLFLCLQYPDAFVAAGLRMTPTLLISDVPATAYPYERWVLSKIKVSVVIALIALYACIVVAWSMNDRRTSRRVVGTVLVACLTACGVAWLWWGELARVLGTAEGQRSTTLHSWIIWLRSVFPAQAAGLAMAWIALHSVAVTAIVAVCEGRFRR